LIDFACNVSNLAHYSAPHREWAACPVSAKADTRPAYRADVSLARLSPPCLAEVALESGALVELEPDGAVMLAR
jgi:hypothetical protein